MAKMNFLTLGVAGLLVATASFADAQYWGGGRTPRQGACFYKDADFRGSYFCAEAGE